MANADQFYSRTATQARTTSPMFRMGDKVRGVKGPGGSMEPERRNLGREGFVTGVHILRGAGCHHYTVSYNDTSTDHIDEVCLERA